MGKPVPVLALLLFSGTGAFANSIVMNTVSLPAGGSSIDFSTLSTGDYKVNISTNGQVTFQADGQAATTEAATLQITAQSANPLGYASMFTDYLANATVTLPNPAAGQMSTYSTQFRFNSSTLPGMFFSNLQYDSSMVAPGNRQLAFQSDVVNLQGKNVSGGTFDFASLSPGTMFVDSDNLITATPQVVASQPIYFGSSFDDFMSGNDVFAGVDNPEPATFILFGSALLAGIAFRRQLLKRRLQ